MRKLSNIVALAVLAGLFVFAIGCDSDSDNNSTGPTIVGDTTDVAFQAVDGFFEDLGFNETFDVSSEFTFDMLEAQFPTTWQSSGRSGLTAKASSVDSSVIIISNYTFANGWHVFTFSATLFEIVNGQIVNSVLASGVDSVQVLKDGIAQQIPDTTANALNIRAHFTVDASSQGFSYTGNHSLGLVLNLDAVSPNLVLNATITQDVNASISDSALVDTVTCNLDITLNQTITNLTFPVDSNDEPSDCPSSGSMVTVATLNLTCGSATSLDSLSINGSWTVTATVESQNKIRVSFTDGTTSWTTTEVCVLEVMPAAPRRFALVSRQAK